MLASFYDVRSFTVNVLFHYESKEQLHIAKLTLELDGETSIWIKSLARDLSLICYHAEIIQLGYITAIMARMLVSPA